MKKLNNEDFEKEFKGLIRESSSNIIKDVFGIVDASVPILLYIRFFHPQDMNPLELIITFGGFFAMIRRELLNHSMRTRENKLKDKYKNMNNTTDIH